MHYYSDPTANKALGPINREFNRLEKKAKAIRKAFREGRITQTELDRAQTLFRGIYRNVLNNVLLEDEDDKIA